MFPYRDVAFLRRQARLGKRRGIRLHGQSVPRGGPELVEVGVALLAGFRAGQGRGGIFRRLQRRGRRAGGLPPATSEQEQGGDQASPANQTLAAR